MTTPLKVALISLIMGGVSGSYAFSQTNEIDEESSILDTKSVDTRLKESPFSVSLEIASRYIWRGLEYGDAPVGFGTLGFNYKGFNAFAMGAYAFNGSHQEVDLGISYSHSFFTIGLSDYYYPSAVGEKDKYFNVRSRETGHWGELYALIKPLRKIDLEMTLSTYVYGADKRPSGKQAFSSYAQLAYTYNFLRKNAISLAVGAALNRGFYTQYEHDFSVVSLSLRYATAFSFGNFKLPVSATYMLNPQTEKSYFSLSLYFNV